MKAMKGMNMNRMLGSLKRKPGAPGSSDGGADSGRDTPEANAIRNVRLFCESGGPDGSGEEVLYLPTIVESCESSPQAAKEAAYSIRKFLSKDHYSKPYIQYNSIMLIRILSDNPGKTFTRNIDEKFVTTVKDLLRNGRDPSVKQILMETLDTFQRQKADHEGLAPLIEMWKKEHERMVQTHGPMVPQGYGQPGIDTHSQNYFSRSHRSRRLPAPHELSARVEEARTSAQLLAQTVQSTPPSELLQNELVREFADRCQSASRSIQAYMVAENPSPDNDTMETLIETNEMLSKSMSQHQRAVLHARKTLGLSSGTPTPPPVSGAGFSAAPPPGPPPARTASGFAAPPGPPPNQRTSPSIQPPARKGIPALQQSTGDRSSPSAEENPFADPADHSAAVQQNTLQNPPFPSDKPPTATGQFNDRTGVEPWHPGFKETPSYMGRQDSAVGHTTMHAGAAPAELETPVEKKNDEEESSGYGTNTGTKAPVYRY